LNKKRLTRYRQAFPMMYVYATIRPTVYRLKWWWWWWMDCMVVILFCYRWQNYEKKYQITRFCLHIWKNHPTFV